MNDILFSYCWRDVINVCHQERQMSEKKIMCALLYSLAQAWKTLKLAFLIHFEIDIGWNYEEYTTFVDNLSGI